jgi:hypothetical protein
MPSRPIVAPRLALALFALLAAARAEAAGISFTRTLLGPHEAGACSEVASGGVNAAGHLVGSYEPAAWRPDRPFLWTPEGGFGDVPFPSTVLGGWGLRINDGGDVTGNSATVSPQLRRGWFWSAATGGVEITPDPAVESQVMSMNNFGTVALVAGEGPALLWSAPRPYLWSVDNGFAPLSDLLGEPYGWPQDINDAGQVVGQTFAELDTTNAIPPARVFRYTPGVGTERLGTVLGTPYGWTHSVNRGGDALVSLDYVLDGNLYTRSYRAVLWGADGSVTQVAPPGASGSEGRYVNDRAEVCGRYESGLPSGGSRAFYWSRETGPIDIGASFPYESDADGINNLGHVVGWYLPVENEWSTLRGYFWSRETGAVDLGPGRAWAINDSDLLGGYANLPDGSYQAAAWTPGPGTGDPPPPPPLPTCSIESLLEKVARLEGAGILKKGAADSLAAKLRRAAAMTAEGRTKAAANVLCAFRSEVEALVKSGRLPAEEGELLTGCSSTLCASARSAGAAKR